MKMFDNFEIQPKSSASPSLFIKTKDINLSEKPNPELLKMVGLNTSTNDFIYFLKIYFSIDNFNVYNENELKKMSELKDTIIALDYERKVYKKLMLNMKKSDGSYIDPYYILPSLGEVVNIDFNDLCSFLNCTEIEKQIFRRIVYIYIKYPDYYETTQRIEEIYEQGKIFDSASPEQIKNTQNIVSKAKFNIIITPNIRHSTTLSDIMINITKKYNKRQKEFYIKSICLLLKKSFIGIKYLLKNRITHNDLHSGNILVQDINGRGMYKVFIFDFDRSYIKGQENKLLNKYCDDYTQCNKFSKWLDMLKLLCYVIRYLHKNMCFSIFSIMSDNRINNTNFDEFYNLLKKNSFFFKKAGKGEQKISYFYHKKQQPEYNTLEKLKECLISIDKVIQNLDKISTEGENEEESEESEGYEGDEGDSEEDEYEYESDPIKKFWGENNSAFKFSNNNLDQFLNFNNDFATIVGNKYN